MPTAEDSSVVQKGNKNNIRHSSVDNGILNGNDSDDNINEEGRYGYFRGLRETDNASEGNSGNVQAGSGKVLSISEEDRKDDGRQYYNERARYLRRRGDLRIRKYSPELVLKFKDNFSDDNGITSKDFFDSISSIKKENGDDGLLVDAHTIEEYDNMRLFLSEDKKTGFAITDDGDLVSVFNSPDTHGRRKEIMANAILNGAVKLDCYDRDILVINYQKWGFVPVAKVKYTEGYNDALDSVHAEKNINYVVSMYYDGSDYSEIINRIKADKEHIKQILGSYIDKVNEIETINAGDDSYSKMLEERDDVLDHKVAEAEAEYKAGKNRTQYSTIESETDEEARNELIEQKAEQDTEIAIENMSDNEELARLSDDGGLFLLLDDFSDDGVQRSM